MAKHDYVMVVISRTREHLGGQGYKCPTATADTAGEPRDAVGAGGSAVRDGTDPAAEKKTNSRRTTHNGLDLCSPIVALL